ncbi:NACHT domain-containing protein [Actinomadura sp. NPDC048394]|uniref:NACHT domain-containing protein n=1 Tax=Actinomadura sp. NPDC048394 TaxID=3158223 RepID=UPI003406B7C9
MVGLVAGTAYVLEGRGLQVQANRAQLVSVVLAVAGLTPLAAVAVRWMRHGAGGVSSTSTPEQAMRAQQRLAHLLRVQWDEEIIIRQLDNPAPLTVRRRFTERPVADHPGNIIGPGGAWSPLARRRVRFDGRSDRIEALAQRLRALPRRRLVILGEAGMGKTTLAVLLLRELLRSRQPDEPVPVLFPLSDWNPAVQPLRSWLADRITDTYPAMRAGRFGPDAVRALLDGHKILPILDGLDEIPEPVRPRVLTALNNALTSDDGLVLTCRTEQYVSAVDATGGGCAHQRRRHRAGPGGPRRSRRVSDRLPSASLRRGAGLQ